MRGFATLIVSLFLACADSTEKGPSKLDKQSKTLQITTTSFPVDYLTRRLIGDAGDVTCINPVGEDPPEYNPPAEAIANLSKADLIIKNGAKFEKWMQTASIPPGKVLDTSKGIKLIPLSGETHSHGKKGSHSHKGFDPHIWSDPKRYAKQAQTIADRLITIDPASKDSINQELTSLKNDLTALEAELSTATKPLKVLTMSANHPAFNYLAEVTGLTIHSFDFDPETPPNDSEIMQWTVWNEHTRGSILLWESKPDPKVASAFKGAMHITLDPLEQPLEGVDYDYIKQMKGNLQTLKTLSKKVFQEENPNKNTSDPGKTSP